MKRRANSSCARITAAVCLVAATCLSQRVESAETRFTIVESDPETWVARGLSDYTITPDNGWTFNISGGTSNVFIRMQGSPLSGTPNIDDWYLNFAAPEGEVLEIGLYENATRFPSATLPSLAFFGSGRANNTLLASFEVLELSLSPSGDVSSFSVDFTHYDEQRLDRRTLAEFRFNIVPEPTTAAILAVASLGLLRRSRDFA